MTGFGGFPREGFEFLAGLGADNTRDVRFAWGKTPYNTHVDLMWWIEDASDPRACPAVIMRLTAGTVLMGGGQHGLRGPALDRYRRLLIDPSAGAGIRAVVDALVASGSQLTEPARARPPRGFPADHPNADLARRDGFHLHHTTAHSQAIESAGFADWCADQLARDGPLLTLVAA